ncbi:hypothetical protein GCM10007111_38540 [Virgibacillus kapii]|uniref:Transposase n=1 Tax=Virgibacillus kapii TaxID=1638645 RepID=A0ABQ2DVZ8_9BACI|nr:hypothetical protein GCM10007111_38540 [Virgibacillus kapii]
MIQGYRNTVTAPSFKAGAAFYLKAHLLFCTTLTFFLHFRDWGGDELTSILTLV